MPSLNDLTYVPPPSVGHEVGVIFGFLGLMAVVMGGYVAIWRIGNKRGEKREAERIEALRASGHLKEKQEQIDEKHEDISEVK